jgi:hypothetical protein
VGSPDWVLIDDGWEGWHGDDTFLDDLLDLVDVRHEALAAVDLMLSVHCSELTRRERRRLRALQRQLRRFMR